MKRLAKFLFPLFALALISIPAWAAAPGKPVIDNPADFNFQTDEGSNLLPADTLKYRYILAKGGITSSDVATEGLKVNNLSPAYRFRFTTIRKTRLVFGIKNIILSHCGPESDLM